MEHADPALELASGATVGVIGGGPAGALSAFFLLDIARLLGIRLQLKLFDPKDFTCTGPAGCNMCGGIISESLVQMMAADGVRLPEEVIIDTIETYTLHTGVGKVRIQAPVAEKRIASIYRGAGPKGAENQAPLPWRSFDQFLFELAMQSGATHVSQRVTAIEWAEDGYPHVVVRNGERHRCDFIVGAVGINGSAMRLFEAMGRGYRPPRVVRAFVGEFYIGAREIRQLLDHSMHVFLLDIPGVKFAALTPKGHYATFIILGDDVDKELIQKVLAHPEVRGCLPAGWKIPILPCQCAPRIHVGRAENFFGDRFAMVGDCAVSRLYKDGIGAAYRTAKALAVTALAHGVSEQALRAYYWPTCRLLDQDNRIGHALFAVDHHVGSAARWRRSLLRNIQREQDQEPDAQQRRLSIALWDLFTGSSSYGEIVTRLMHPSVVARMLLRSFG